MHGLRRLLSKLDQVIYQVERALLLVSVLMMTALVFADVIQRTFSRPVGKTAELLLALAGGAKALEPATVKAIQDTWGPGAFAVLSLGLLVAATQSARTLAAARDDRPAPGMAVSIGIGLGAFLLTWGGIELLLYVAPSGIPGAQKFALGFLVWSGFLGASLAARSGRHIVLDAVRRKLTGRGAMIAAGLSGVLAGGFCWFLAFLGYDKSWTEIMEWSDSDGAIHVFEAAPVPVWLVTLAIPIGLTVVGARLLAVGVSEVLYGPSLQNGPDEHGIDFDQLAAVGAGAGADAETGTNRGLMGRPHDEGGRA